MFCIMLLPFVFSKFLCVLLYIKCFEVHSGFIVTTPYFAPIVQGWGWEAPSTQFLNINVAQERIPRAICTKFSEFRGQVHGRLSIKIWGICSGVPKLWVLDLGVRFPQIFSSPMTKLRCIPKMLWIYSITVPSFWGWDFACLKAGEGRAKNRRCSACFFRPSSKLIGVRNITATGVTL